MLALRELTVKAAKEFGVTVVTDHNGAWGNAGRTYLTLRWGSDAVAPGKDDLLSATFSLDQISSAWLDEVMIDLDQEDK